MRQAIATAIAALQFRADRVVLLLTSCTSTIQSRIYRPEPIPASVTWTGRAPEEVTTGDGVPLLLGITKASLSTESFISAASA